MPRSGDDDGGRHTWTLSTIGFAHVTVAAVEREAATASGVSDRHGAFVVPGAPAGGPVRVEVSHSAYRHRVAGELIPPGWCNLWRKSYRAPQEEWSGAAHQFAKGENE